MTTKQDFCQDCKKVVPTEIVTFHEHCIQTCTKCGKVLYEE